MGKSISVTLSGRVGTYLPHLAFQKTLVARLLREGMLERVLEVTPHPEVFDPAGDGSLKLIRHFPFHRMTCRPLWSIWRRLPKIVRDTLPPTALYTTTLADWLLRPWVPRTEIFHGVMNNCLLQLTRARQLGAVTLVDVGSRHPKLWWESVLEERRRFGFADRRGVYSGLTLRYMEREFEICDKITVLSTPARDSFAEFGYGHKAEIVLPGIDHEFFTPPERPVESSVFRVCYAGRVELAKGLGYLLEAWKRLALPKAELVLAGTVQADVRGSLKNCADANIKLAGFLSPQQLAECYRESNLFVFPSSAEGFGQVLLEAMACGVPVAGSDRSGAIDCVSEGVDGFVVPARNVEQLADAIVWGYRHREELQEMGRAARAKIEKQYTLQHYYQRMINLYRSLLA